MRNAAREKAFQIALRNCSREVGGKVSQYICDFGEGGMHAIKHIFFLQKVSASHDEQTSL